MGGVMNSLLPSLPTPADSGGVWGGVGGGVERGEVGRGMALGGGSSRLLTRGLLRGDLDMSPPEMDEQFDGILH